MSETGHIVWPGAANPLWVFDWRLADAPDEEGIVILAAFYRGHRVFSKASLPSLRVQYHGPCGPFKDPLNYNNAHPTTRCPRSRVCAYSYTGAGRRALSVESYHTIGAYRLTHRWTFWEHGVVMPRLFSAGLQCHYDHRHHTYWRFDFDIDNSRRDLLLEYNNYTADEGWGTGWHPFRTETKRVKNPPSRRSWAVLDRDSGRGYHLLPGANDGVANAFSSSDLWLLRYRASEDRYGRQGGAHADGLDAYVNGESTDGQDVVVWYCGHLFHRVHEGGDDWHSVGPDLVPFGPW
ncbi:hypothetical protein ACFY41_08685 [Streptomyces syringium]|uniref:hypothetical protein n=1 Tax=Streptomyces syringium TaxID=76729 RepID=UPI00367C485D